MGNDANLPLLLLVLIFAASLLLPTNSWAARAVIVKPAVVVLDGNVVGNVNVGQTVSILGINDETGEILISVSQEGAPPLVGLISGDSLLDKSNIPSLEPHNSDAKNDVAHDSQIISEQASRKESNPFSSTKVWTAEELSEFLRYNREKFSEFKGEKLKVTGRVSSLRVSGRGPTLQMELGLETPPTFPRIKLQISPTYLMSQQFNERFGFKKDVYGTEPKVNFRSSRDTISGQAVWEKTTTYTYGGTRTYQSKRKSESEWLPVVSLNSNITATAVLSDNRFEIVLTDGEFVD